MYTNKVTRRAASKITGMRTQDSGSIMRRPAQKAINIVAMEKKSVDNPRNNLVAKDTRKSYSSYLEVKIPKNTNTEAVEEKTAIPMEINEQLKVDGSGGVIPIGMHEYFLMPIALSCIVY
ncbi:hypothetical protein TIFTF001_038398 [Ficus carica]|uniref:Uncharacterized protein n=1 Tax=Ficus carica TaxID=3494 RepID=A0AA88E772_FICCA|nr:hypothetical protein TIFTF001_038398 [Ficus carica]